MEKIPVILDTDIGTDIDDTWALGMVVNCPELDLRYVCTATGDTRYRARITCKFLEAVGRVEVPVGAGLQEPMDPARRTQADWVTDHDLAPYPGEYDERGVDRMIRIILESPEPIALIAIGPLTNLAAALAREPAIAGRCHLVGMHGSIHAPYEGQTELAAEYNVRCDVEAARATFAAPWRSITITPLDTCGKVRLRGDLYRRVRESPKLVHATIMENYRGWRWVGDQFEQQSSILFDTVAVHLAVSHQYLQLAEMRVAVDDQGHTVERADGAPMQVALAWTDLPAYERHLVDRLLGEGRR